MGRHSDYKPEYCERVIELGKAGKSRVQIAVALDTSRASMDRWAEAHPEFRTALTRAKECEQDWWENKGQEGLTADKFNSAVWSKSMSARFRDDYTERRQTEVDLKTDLSKEQRDAIIDQARKRTK
jgi:transposase